MSTGSWNTSLRVLQFKTPPSEIFSHPEGSMDLIMKRIGKDMARFLIMLNNEGKTRNGIPILKPETTALMGEAEKSTLDIDSFFQPGLGWDTMDDAAMRYAGRAWMKSGGTGDYNSLMEVLPDRKLGVIVLTNADKAGQLMWGVVRKCLRVIQHDGKEKLLCGGYRAYAMDKVPGIASGAVASGTVELFKSDWFRFDAVSPVQRVDITVTTDGANYSLTVFDENLNLIGREMGAISWLSQPGSYFVEISPTPDATGNYTMTVN
jgi:hypothetical protein